MLGDGMWEGMRLYNGKWAFFDEHMDRFFDSCKAVSLDVGMDKAGILDALTRTARANGMTDDVHCRLMLTRGVKAKPFQHPVAVALGADAGDHHGTLQAGGGLHGRGIRLATVPQVRGLPMSQDAKYNSHSKLNCVIACLQAEQAGADEALMLDPHGFVNTTNACNFFIVRRGEVWTSTGDYCMNGVTRQKVIELCRDNGIPVFEKNYHAVRNLRRRRGVPDRHVRRADPGRRDRRQADRRRRASDDRAHPDPLQGAGRTEHRREDVKELCKKTMPSPTDRTGPALGVFSAPRGSTRSSPPTISSVA